MVVENMLEEGGTVLVVEVGVVQLQLDRKVVVEQW